MLPDSHMTYEGQEPQEDTKKYLQQVLLELYRKLRSEGLDTKKCKFLGKNDIFIHRFTDVSLVFFSRDTSGIEVTIAEFDRRNSANAENNSGTESDNWAKSPIYPSLVSPEDARNFMDLEEIFSPVVLMVPRPHLELEGDQFESAAKESAEMLMEPTREDIDKENRIVRINPIFQGRDFEIDPELVFVLMQFSSPYTEIFDDVIEPVVSSEGFRCLKSDDIFGTTAVIEDIWANINRSALVIAEITDNNPNVMYELGICHTIGKEVMMITQAPSTIPFNFRHMRAYSYDNSIRGSTELRNNISGVLRQITAASEM